MPTTVSHGHNRPRRPRKGVVNIASVEKAHDAEAPTLEVRQGKADRAKLRLLNPRLSGDVVPGSGRCYRRCPVPVCGSVACKPRNRSGRRTPDEGAEGSKGGLRPLRAERLCLLSATWDRLSRDHSGATPERPVWRRRCRSTRGAALTGGAACTGRARCRTGKRYNRPAREGKAATGGKGTSYWRSLVHLERRLGEC